MRDDEGPNWKPRILNKEVRVFETTLEDGLVVRMHCHFGKIDMAHFERMCWLHPNATYAVEWPEGLADGGEQDIGAGVRVIQAAGAPKLFRNLP